MKSLYVKSLLMGLAIALVAAFNPGLAATVSAASNNDGTPRLNKISDVTKTTAVLPIQFKKLEDKRVVVTVSIRNRDTGATMSQKFNVKLSDSGRTKVTVKNLTPDTKYSFKVKIRRETSKHNSHNSDSRTIVTER